MSYLDEHKNKIFKKYSNEELCRDVISYRDGGKLSKVLNHFLKNVFLIAPMQKQRKHQWKHCNVMKILNIY